MLSGFDEWDNIMTQLSQELIPETDVVIINDTNTLNTSGWEFTHSDLAECNTGNLVHTKNSLKSINNKISSFEWNFFILDGSYELVDDETRIDGFISEEICNGECDFLTTKPNISVDNPYGGLASDRVTFGIDTELGEYPTKFDTTEYTISNKPIVDGSKKYWTFGLNHETTTFGIIINKWSMPFRRARITELIPGKRYYWDKNDISNFSYKRSLDMVNAELPQFNCSFGLIDTDRKYIQGTEEYKRLLFDTVYVEAVFVLFYGCKFDGSTTFTYRWIDCFYCDNIDRKTNSLEVNFELIDNISKSNQRFNTQDKPKFKTYRQFLNIISGEMGIYFHFRNCNFIDIEKGALSLGLVRRDDFYSTELKVILQLVACITNSYIYKSETGQVQLRCVWDKASNDIKPSNITEAYKGVVIPLNACFEYPEIQETNNIKEMILTISTFGREAGNIDSFVGNEPPARYRKTYDAYGVEQTAENQYIYYTSPDSSAHAFAYADDLHTPYMDWVHTFMSNKKIITAKTVIDPRWQLGDYIGIELADENIVYGFLTGINLEYSGTFKGDIKILSGF